MFTTNIWIGILLHLSIRICNTGSTLFSTSLSLVLFQYYIFAVFNIKALVYALAKQFHFSPLFAKCMFNIRTTCIKPIYQSFFLQLHFSPSFCAEGKNNNGNYAKKLANWLGRCVLYKLANGVIYVRHCWPITYVWRGIFRKNWRIG